MSRFERILVRWSSWATGLTGLAYLWMKHFMTASDPWAAVNHPLQPWVLKAHILVAPVLVFALGVISVGHVWRHWRRRVPSGRRSGLLLMLVAGPMIVTGYAVQVLLHPTWLSVAAWSHIGLGVLYLAGLLVHAVAFVRGRTDPHADGDRRSRGPAGGGGRGGAREEEALPSAR